MDKPPEGDPLYDADAAREHDAATLIQGRIQAYLDRKALDKAVRYAAALAIQNAWREHRERMQKSR